MLSMDGEIFHMDSGHWTKIEARLVVPDEHTPHGVRYCLTLHNRLNHRLLGYDNAHGIKPQRKKYGARRVVWDHRHKGKLVEPYEFESALQLLEDFWADVDRIIGA